jgi:hypothetical protein
VDDGLRLIFDHLDEHFDRALETARHARRRLAGGQTQQTIVTIPHTIDQNSVSMFQTWMSKIDV